MSGPVTAAELLQLAEQQIEELICAAGTQRAANAAELAAGWPAFHRAGRQLIAALHPDLYGQATPPAHQRAPGQLPAAAAPPPATQLTRAAELICAAADLIGGRDRRALSAADRDADLTRACRPLIAAAYLVAQSSLPHPALLEAAMTATTAAHDWSSGQAELYRDPRTGSMHDASTRLSTTPDVDQLGLPAALNSAVARWQQAALAAAQHPAPSSADLQGTARSAGSLIALTQVLLRAHHPADGPYSTEPARTITDLQAAGRSWNAAVDSWGNLRTGTPPDAELQAATADLRQAVRLLGRSGAHWAPPHVIRDRTEPGASLTAARGALIAVQSVADLHAPLVTELARTSGLYLLARQLTPTEDNLDARLAKHWLPATIIEHRPLTAAYQQLPGATTLARLSYTALTSPAGGPPPDQQPEPDLPAEKPNLTVEPPQPPPTPDGEPLASRRWQHLAHILDPRLLDDPHWRALAAALDRVALAGVDVDTTLTSTLAHGPLPDEHPARTLHYRLVDVCDAAAIPNTTPAITRPPSRTVNAPHLPTPTPPAASRRR